MRMAIIEDFREEKKEILKPEAKPFPELQRLWQNSGAA